MDENISHSLSPVLNENTSIVTCAEYFRLNLIDNSLQPDNEEISACLKSDSDASYTGAINASKLLGNSLCATPNKINISLRSRTRQKGLNKPGSSLANNIEMSVNTSTELEIGHTYRRGFKSRARHRVVPNLSTNVDSNSPVNNEKESRVTRQHKRKDIKKAFQTAFETSCETDVSVIINQRESAFFKHAKNAKQCYDEYENFNSSKATIVRSTTGQEDFTQPSDTKDSEYKNEKRQFSKRLGNNAYSGSENPFASVFASDSTDTSQLKSFELSSCETASRPILRKRGFLSKNTRIHNKSFDEDLALSSRGSDRQKKIKMNSNNVFEAAFETSIETDASDISLKKSRFVKNKITGKKCLSLEAFQNVLDSSTDVSDAQLVSKRENGAIISQSGVSESNLLNRCDEEKVNSDGKDAIDVTTSPNRLTENVDNPSADVDKQVNENSDVMYNDILKNNTSKQSETSEPPNVSLHVQSHCTNLVNKTAESVLPVDVNTDKPLRNAVNPSIENSVLSQNNSVNKKSVYKQNSLVVNGSNEAGNDDDLSLQSAVLHIETDYDSMDSSSESDASDHMQENPTLPSASESESPNNNFTKEDCVSSHNDLVDCSGSLDKTQHYTQNVLSINCENNCSISLPIRRSSRKSNLLINGVSVNKENDQLSILYTDAIVRVNENFDSMEMTDCSIPLEQTGLSKASSNKSIPIITSTQIVADCHHERDRLSILSQLEGQNSIVTMTNNDSNQNPSATAKNISAIETVGNIDVVSFKLASPSNHALKTRTNNENPLQSSHINESLLNPRHTLTNSSITVASLRKRYSMDKSNNVQISLGKRVAKDSQNNKENSPLLTTKYSLRKKPCNSSKIENSDNPEAIISLCSKVSSNNDVSVNSVNESKCRSQRDSDNSKSTYKIPISRGVRRISDMDIQLSVLKNNRTSNKNALKKDCEILERMLTFPNSLKASNVKQNKAGGSKASTVEPRNTDKQNKAGGSNVVCNENDISWFSKTPKLKKPKSWVSQILYKFIIKKLQPTYSAKSQIRAEKFVIFLCNKVVVVQNLTEKELYKNQVNELMIEMARLKLVTTYLDFYDFVGKYLPHSFSLKSVPMITPFNREHLVDYEPDKLFSNIL